MEVIKKVEFKSGHAEIGTSFHFGLIPKGYSNIKAYDVDEESLMENLNFEDVMNYYGVSKVCEWCEANR